MQPWFTAYVFDIGHPCYGQMTLATGRKRYRVTSTRDHIAGPSLELIEVTCLFDILYSRTSLQRPPSKFGQRKVALVER